MSDEQQPVTTARLQQQNRELEARIARQADTLIALQLRAQLAEKSAADAWQFAKMLRGCGPHQGKED